MPNESEYEILLPGRLIVTYLREGDYDPDLSGSGVISVVRNTSKVGIDSEVYKPVAALTKERERLFRHVDGGYEVSLFKA